jgi:hypothetical protein
MAQLFYNVKNKQSGVTLLLSVLILAAITAIAFSLAAIILVEVRSSGDVTRTEPALYAAQAITEEAFFKYQRSVSDTALDISTVTFNNVVLTSGLKQYDQAPRIDTIPAGSSVDYLLVNPSRTGDFDTKVFNSISFTALNSVLNASAAISKCCDASGNSISVQTFSLPVNTKNTYTITDSKQYTLTVTNSNTSAPLLIQIEPVKTAADASCGTACIPLLGKVLDISSSYLGLTRKYSVSVTTGTPAAVPPATSNFLVDTNNSLSSGLISYWKLEEASGSRTDSKGSNSLASNGVTSSVGVKNNAGLFTEASSQYLNTADNSSLSTGDADFTIAGWVYMNSKATFNAANTIVGKWNYAAGQREYILFYSGFGAPFTVDRFQFAVSPDGTNVATVAANALGSPSTGVWYFIVAWHDSVANTVNIQINNGTVNSVATSTGVLDGTSEFDIGRFQSQNYWNGRIDEVGFWKRVLTNTERTDLYNSGNGNTCSNGC